ncbi:MAG TPA: amidase family protein [Caulobacteraceae bacterium]|jgi:amidase|nr:amidase family protein [Caulobacteraceae bacterium]
MLKEKLDYATATAGGLAEALAARKVSAAELCEEAISAIEAKDGPINAVVVRDFDRARDAAKAADAALARGERAPLLGVPMTVKESNHVPGLPTTWGLAPFKGWTPKTEAIGVTRLKAAGAVILGKTNVPPSLGDWQANNPIYGRTNNPHDLGRSPGGSSGGGAAALASGMVPLEYGSDIGGSIRVPAHFSGVFGHKPTYGLVPLAGHSPPPIDGPGADVEFGVVGPLARTASDLALALGVLAGPEGDLAKAYRLDLPPPRGAALADFRVLVIDAHPLAQADSEVLRPLHALAGRLEAAGADVARSSALLPDLAAAQATYMALLGTIMGRGRPGAQPSLDTFDYMGGLDRIALAQAEWAELFNEFDVVLAPPFGTAAFPHTDEPEWGNRRLTINGEPTPYGAQIAWPGIATFPGLPATCAPIGKTSGGLPVGVQIIGPRYEDRTPIAFAGLIEREFGAGL